MQLVKLLLILTITSIIPGQLIRISPVPTAAITVSDIATMLLVATFTIHSLAVKKSLKLSQRLFVPLAIFIFFALASTVFATQNFRLSEITISLLFMVRFILYCTIFIVTANTVSKSDVTKWLNLFLAICTLYAFIGFLQVVFFPDLTSLAVYGWDPHQARIVSTFLDPNFSGGLLTIAFSISISLFLNTKKNVYLIISSVAFTALILTFSRSSYLALLTAILVIGVLKSPKILAVFLLASIISFILVSQVRNRVIGALTFDETSQARIDSWQKALTIFRDNAVFGVGFNTYRFAQADYGFFSSEQPEGGHSGAGTDSSILLVAVTTGIVGLAAYFALLINILKTFAKKSKKSALALGGTAAFLALIVHSQFVNSLFFPQIMLSLFFLLGLAQSYDN